jgi:hypothetical protein
VPNPKSRKKRKAGKWFAFDELLQHNNKKHIFQKNTANSSKNALLFKKKMIKIG